MVTDPPVKPKRSWKGVVIATALGIAATVGVGWYQLVQADKQAILAEDERARSVRSSLVSIVEEHVLNDKQIDLPRLTRLIQHRRREERVATSISVRDLLEKAEFNILESRYLAFERKLALKAVFDSLYADLNSSSITPFTQDTPNADLLNDIARSIQDGKPRDALAALTRLQEAHIRDVDDARTGRSISSKRDPIEELLNEPWPLILTAIVYIVGLFVFVTRRREFLGWLSTYLRRRMPPEAARRRIGRYREEGLDDIEIVERLGSYGVPRQWIERELQQSGEDESS